MCSHFLAHGQAADVIFSPWCSMSLFMLGCQFGQPGLQCLHVWVCECVHVRMFMTVWVQYCMWTLM